MQIVGRSCARSAQRREDADLIDRGRVFTRVVIVAILSLAIVIGVATTLVEGADTMELAERRSRRECAVFGEHIPQRRPQIA